MLNLEWFRTFKVIYEAGTLSAAAQVLFISQPGVSLHLSSLESYTGYRLFDRDTRRMTATDRGTMLYNYIVEHLNKLEEAEKVFHGRSRLEKPTISVGMSLELFQYILESHITELPFNLVTTFGDYPQMLQQLSNGALDLIIATQKGSQPNLEYTHFTTSHTILICGSKTDTSELNKLLSEEENKTAVNNWLSKQIWYTVAADMEQLKRFWMSSFKSPPGFRPNFVVPYIGSILKCLSGGIGFAVVPDFLCRQELEDNVVKLAWEGCPPVTDTLYFAKRTNSSYTSELTQLENIFRKNLPAGQDLSPEIGI